MLKGKNKEKDLKFGFTDISVSFLVFWSKGVDWNISKMNFRSFVLILPFNKHVASGCTFYK